MASKDQRAMPVGRPALPLNPWHGDNPQPTEWTAGHRGAYAGVSITAEWHEELAALTLARPKSASQRGRSDGSMAGCVRQVRQAWAAWRAEVSGFPENFHPRLLLPVRNLPLQRARRLLIPSPWGVVPVTRKEFIAQYMNLAQTAGQFNPQLWGQQVMYQFRRQSVLQAMSSQQSKVLDAELWGVNLPLPDRHS